MGVVESQLRLEAFVRIVKYILVKCKFQVLIVNQFQFQAADFGRDCRGLRYSTVGCATHQEMAALRVRRIRCEREQYVASGSVNWTFESSILLRKEFLQDNFNIYFHYTFS